MNEVWAGFMQFFRERLAQEAAQGQGIGKFSWDVSRGHKINMSHSAPRGLLVRSHVRLPRAASSTVSAKSRHAEVVLSPISLHAVAD